MSKSIPGLTQQHCELAARICGALAHIGRYRIVSELTEAPRTATELRDSCGMSKSQLSQHAKILIEAGLIHGITKGKSVRYETRSDAARTLRLAIAAATEQIAKAHIVLGVKMKTEEAK